MKITEIETSSTGKFRVVLKRGSYYLQERIGSNGPEDRKDYMDRLRFYTETAAIGQMKKYDGERRN